MFTNLASQIERELSPGERLLWNGKPKQGLCLRPADAFMIPFSLLWCGFAIFWEFSAMSHGAPVFFMLWGIPFIAIGLYIVFGRFFVDAQMRERTYYGVTNERLIIVSGLFSRQTKSLPLHTLSDLSLTERADGSGTITLGPTLMPFMQNLPAGWPGAGHYSPPSFEMIDRVKETYELIRQAQRGTTI